MDFALSSEQALLRDNAQRFVARDYPIETRRRIAAQENGFSPAVWGQFAEMGWLGLAVPAELGGVGLGPADYAVVQEQLGAGLVIESLLELGVLVPQLLIAAGDRAKAERLVPEIVEGRLKLALAHSEQANAALGRVATRADRSDGGWRLQGAKTLVIGAAAAEGFIVSARTGGAAGDEDGLSLFLVPGDAPGLRRSEVVLTDDSRAASLVFEGVTLAQDALVGRAGAAFPAIATANAWRLLGVCAEALGAMERAMLITRDYLKTRKQFGVTIGSFQVLQHRMADMRMEVELSRSILFRALADFEDPQERDLTLAAAKAQISKAGYFVGAQSVQLHGGIGMAEEYLIGGYFKRLHLIRNQFGSAHHHLARIGGAYSQARTVA